MGHGRSEFGGNNGYGRINFNNNPSRASLSEPHLFYSKSYTGARICKCEDDYTPGRSPSSYPDSRRSSTVNLW